MRIGWFCSCKDALIQTQYNYLKALDDKDCNYVKAFCNGFSKAFNNVKYSSVSLIGFFFQILRSSLMKNAF